MNSSTRISIKLSPCGSSGYDQKIRCRRGVKSAVDSCFVFCQAGPMFRLLRIKYPDAPPASPERLAMAGRVISRDEPW